MQVLETNRRVQQQNNAPKEFPAFVRRGYAIRVIADGYAENEQGLIYKVGMSLRLDGAWLLLQMAADVWRVSVLTIGEWSHAVDGAQYSSSHSGCARTLSRALAPCQRMARRSSFITQHTMNQVLE